MKEWKIRLIPRNWEKTIQQNLVKFVQVSSNFQIIILFHFNLSWTVHLERQAPPPAPTQLPGSLAALNQPNTFPANALPATASSFPGTGGVVAGGVAVAGGIAAAPAPGTTLAPIKFPPNAAG